MNLYCTARADQTPCSRFISYSYAHLPGVHLSIALSPSVCSRKVATKTIINFPCSLSMLKNEKTYLGFVNKLTVTNQALLT